MDIIESSIIGKKIPEACEDGMVVTDDFIAVIDGSTSKTPKHLNPDMKNGRYAMMLISEYIREELKADASVDDFCQGVTAYIYNKVYEKLGVEERLKEHPEERLTASAILYSRTRNEVWMVGDCQAIIDGKLYENGKPYEEKIARKRVELIEQGLSPAEARKQIEPLLVEAMLSMHHFCIIGTFQKQMISLLVSAILQIHTHFRNIMKTIINREYQFFIRCLGKPFCNRCFVRII